MYKKQDKQEGSVLVVVLAIAVLVLGATTYYFFRKSNKTSTTSTTSSAQNATDATKGTKSTSTPKTDTPTTDNTTTYEDPTWHYSFKYPKTWTLESKNGDTTLTSQDYKTKVNGISVDAIETGSIIKVTMNARDAIKSLDDFIHNDVAGLVGSSKISIAGYDAVETDMNTEVNGITSSYFLYREKSYVNIRYDYLNSRKSNNVDSYNIIRDSFKIIP